MQLKWWRKNKIEHKEEYSNEDAVAMCNSIRFGKLDGYLKQLEKGTKQDIINRFLGIIYAKSSFLPIVGAAERPPITVDGISVDPIQNSQARRMTKITLLLLLGDESKKIGIWDQIEQVWTENYILEIKTMVQVTEAIAKQLENSGEIDRAADLRKGIIGMKEANKKYNIEW